MADISPHMHNAAKAARHPNAVAKVRLNPLHYAGMALPARETEEATFLDQFENRMTPGVEACAVGRARVGLYLLVKHAVRSGRRRVCISPFTIVDVANMIVLAGGEPVFFDTLPNSTRCDIDHLASLVSDTTACVLITHYHVNEADIDAISNLCRTHGAYLFDDCALALGGKLGETPIGSATDASVFSFSAFKLLNYFLGGLVTTGDPAIVKSVKSTVANWPRLRAQDYAIQAGKVIRYDLATQPSVFKPIVFPMMRKRTETTNHAASLEWQRIENTTLDASLTSRPGLAAFREWNTKFGRIETWLAGRREVARVYLERLSDIVVAAPLSARDVEEGCFSCFPVRVDPQRTGAIRCELMRSGFDTGANLYPNLHRHPGFTACAGKSEHVDALVKGSIFLPTHFGVTPDYARALSQRLIQLI